jgi:hypothetical protein
MHSRADQIKSQERSESPQHHFDAGDALRTLSLPRLTGSQHAQMISAELHDRFESLGYQVHDQRFVISTWPGRFAVSLAGFCYVVGGLLAAGVLWAGHPGISVVLLLTVLFVVGAIAVLVKPAMLIIPFGRVEASNLIATVPGKRPRYYLMAHRDSKSQGIPLAFRGPAIVLGIITWIALLALSLLVLLDPVFNKPTLIVVLGTAATVAGALLFFCWVENKSPGSLDNASGVATLLGVAEREVQSGDVAFIVTDAEELGLAGSRAVAASLPPSFGVINVDGIDDEGRFYIIERFGWPRKQGSAPHLAAALLGAAAAQDHDAQRRDVPIGLLLDHMPIVTAGTPAVTLMRGTLKSLSRVHRPADNLSSLRGTGVTSAVALVSAALQLLRNQST